MYGKKSACTELNNKIAIDAVSHTVAGCKRKARQRVVLAGGVARKATDKAANAS